ncbi:MAG: tetratricopeptide repeat protein, partial [Vulcanimicrobiota bacterium]
ALFEEASEIYGRKISMFPYQWRNYYRRGSCFAEMYKLEDARKDLIEALELRGEFSVNVAEKLSDILYKLHYYEDARLLLEALILSNPQDYEYYGKMGMCFIAAQDFEKAFEAFNRSLGLNPYEPEYLYGAGVSAAHLNFTDDALDLIRDLLEFDDGFVEIVEKEPAFSDMENNDDFFALISEVKARRNNKISGENTGRETDEDSETEPGE